MTPLESARAELRAAALNYADNWLASSDDDRMASVIARLEVASKAFAEASWRSAKPIENCGQEAKTPPGNQSGGVY